MGEPACYAHFLDEDGRMPDRPHVQIKRVYDPGLAEPQEFRVLVDGVWPRGVGKESLALDYWARDLAPSAELRRWFAHDLRRWPEFERRYREELGAKASDLMSLKLLARGRRLVLLYGARDETHNQAAVLRDVLEEAL